MAGSHNTYEKKDTFENLFDALNYVQVIEIDVWVSLSVGHGGTPGNDNNCPKGGKPGATRNQDVRSCIDCLTYWHGEHPNHPLVVVKFETKNWGAANLQLDRIILERLPREAIFAPSDVLRVGKGRYSNPDDAVRAGNWPTMKQLQGKFMFVLAQGSLLKTGPADYAEALQHGYAGLIFPAVFVTSDEDPRVRYCWSREKGTEKWFVVSIYRRGPRIGLAWRLAPIRN